MRPLARVATILCAVLGATFAFPAAADDAAGTAGARPSVRVVSPSTQDIPVGDTRIVAAIDGYVSGDQIDVFVDGRKVGTATQPPWQVAWQAGDALRGHTI